MAARKNTVGNAAPVRWSTHRATQVGIAERKLNELDLKHAAALAIADAIYAFLAKDPPEHVDDDTPGDLALHLRDLINEMHERAHGAMACYRRTIAGEKGEAANG